MWCFFNHEQCQSFCLLIELPFVEKHLDDHYVVGTEDGSKPLDPREAAETRDGKLQRVSKYTAAAA